jgi:hypothetical protein
MANSNGSFGLRPISKLGGGSNSTGLTGYTPYEIASDNAGKLYHGQIVVPLASGYIDHTSNAAGGTVSALGVFQGCEYVSSTTGKRSGATTGLVLGRIQTTPLRPLSMTILISCM